MYGISQLFSQDALSGRNQSPLLSLKPGQLFTGNVLKHYPDQLASVSIRGMTVIAKLETPVAAGSSYWFMVKEGKDLPRLQIVQPDTPKDSFRSESFGSTKLTSSKEGQALLAHLKHAGIPFTQNQLTDGTELIKSNATSMSSGLKMIDTMIRQQLPLTPTVYHALLSLEKTEGLSESLSKLISTLGDTKSGETLQTMLQRAQGPITRSPIDQIIRMIQDPEVNQETKQVAVRVLAKLDWPQLTPQTSPNELVSKWNKEQVEQTSLVKQLLPNPSDQKQVSAKWATIFEQSLDSSEKDIVQTALRQSVTQTVITEGKPIPFVNQLQQLMQGAGYQHEADFHEGKPVPSSIKSVLLQLVNESGSPEVRAQAEQVLNKITGYQLHSVQSDSLVNVLVQIPMKLGEHQTDMTLQWQGKKQEDGQLNPDDCRLLFFLELEHLQETMIQVTIQHKIVQVNVTNALDKPSALIQLLEPHLRESLRKQDFKLSSISWNSWEAGKVKAKEPLKPTVHTHYQGMDIRI
ncbi:hypothetical protein [Alkalicoccobacillus murimartini]|uniref:Flagellar hook-length control protein-like C-terminal domain-containing protein n=1 Tax=Alkalicoccobacillus murimartini TaxID=171685 RepID=A0ABT9YET5_9BACI|nr:hypothetical protein [Alkalicoccobacillus murimartini]MDQ0206363.1 hypothetical protein [Alkalicoccobacillus murimartini]